jgi:hypothetical protein
LYIKHLFFLYSHPSSYPNYHNFSFAAIMVVVVVVVVVMMMMILMVMMMMVAVSARAYSFTLLHVSCFPLLLLSLPGLSPRQTNEFSPLGFILHAAGPFQGSPQVLLPLLPLVLPESPHRLW